MADQIVVLQVRDPALVRYDIAEELLTDPSKHGARVVDLDVVAEIAKRGVVLSIVGTQSSLGVTPIYTPPAGMAARIVRTWIKGAHSIPDGTVVEFILELGGTEIDHDEVVADQPYVNGGIREGSSDDALTLELLTAEKVFFNIAVQLF